jgi:prevent-host-death family protein
MWEHVFVHAESSNRKGAVAELKIAAAAVSVGIPVLRPMTEHGRYDLVFEIGDRLLRIQCKWAARKGDVVVVHTGGNYLSPRGYVRSTYSADEIDAIAAYCGDLDRCYLLPIDLVAGQYVIHLRLAPTKNAQRAAIHWAAEYEFTGAVAQLEVAPRWHRGGRGFESRQLHQPDRGIQAVGAHEFRNLFGLYMQRASRGESFLVTRRGKPFVRLVPAADPLPLAAERAA